MKYIREYYNYDNEVAEICKKWGIINWSIRDGLVDVDGGVDLSDKKLTKLPLKFGRVSGYFSCRCNQLTTLEGSPSEVGRWFDCYGNQITTLEHFPRVGGDIYLFNNPLPKEIMDNIRYLKKIIEWQDEYDIWRDGKLYLPRFRDLMIDIKEGL